MRPRILWVVEWFTEAQKWQPLSMTAALTQKSARRYRKTLLLSNRHTPRTLRVVKYVGIAGTYRSGR